MNGPLPLRAGVLAPGRDSRTTFADPRTFQIAVLASLLAYGALYLDLEVRPLHAATAIAVALAAQGAFTQLFDLARFDPKSALISGLSLSLLLRAQSVELVAVAAVVAVASKFLLRFRDKHLFNPANFAIVAALIVGDGVWISSGQWGAHVLFAFALLMAGSVVLRRAERSDVTWAFLVFYGGGLFVRAAWLGDPWSIPAHQLQSGALLIFAFFMISDPKTTPDSRAGRVVFAAAVAATALFVRFGLYRPNGLMFALAAATFVVPLLDIVFPGLRFQWGQPPRGAHRASTWRACNASGVMHENQVDYSRRGDRAVLAG